MQRDSLAAQLVVCVSHVTTSTLQVLSEPCRVILVAIHYKQLPIKELVTVSELNFIGHHCCIILF